MHEFSIARSLLSRAEIEARARGAHAVRSIHLKLGVLSGVEPDLLVSAYEILRQGGLCATAPLEIDRVPALWSCPRCERAIPPGDPLTCPSCGAGARLVAGDETLLEQLELEVA